jgi:hypothetical protein
MYHCCTSYKEHVEIITKPISVIKFHKLILSHEEEQSKGRMVTDLYPAVLPGNQKQVFVSRAVFMARPWGS